MAQRSHVPKFGNWDGDNVPYTAYFENARKEKAGGIRLINPNDPEQNPDPEAFSRRRTLSSESSTKHQNKKSTADSVNYINADDFSSRSVSVPKFGEWDEHDPKSAQGFTLIFNKVKEEKQMAAAKFPPLPLNTTNNFHPTQEKETTKKCCCLF